MYADKQDKYATYDSAGGATSNLQANRRDEFPHQIPGDGAVSPLASARQRRPIIPPAWRTPCSVLFMETRPGQMAALVGTAPLDARTSVVSSQDDALAQFIRRPADPYRLAETPDVLVMDHDLPESLQESDQKPFLARLQELRITQQALVVIVTPSITMTQKIRAFQLGASHVLVEPLSPQSFWLALRLLLRFRELAPLISWRTVTTEGHGH